MPPFSWSMSLRQPPQHASESVNEDMDMASLSRVGVARLPPLRLDRLRVGCDESANGGVLGASTAVIVCMCGYDKCEVNREGQM